MLNKSGVTESLARHIVATQWDQVPSQVRHQAKRSLVNFFAVTLAGCRSAPIEIARRSLAEFSGGKQVALIGNATRIDALSAAFLNAAGANVDDFCDTHTATVIHPTAPVAGALFSYAGLQRISGSDLLLALVLGNEVQARIGLAISPSHYNRGWHITSTCGVFGAATAIGKLLQLDERRTVWALGIAATQSAGLCECLGTPAKSVSVGNAARNGLWSALLAEKGFDGPGEPLAGAQGFYHALDEEADLSFLTEGWGEKWEIMATSYKPYPCGFVINPVLDCVLDWRRENPDCRSRARRGARKSAVERPCRPAARIDRPRGASQRAACGCGCSGEREGRARSVFRRMRARSGRVETAQQGRARARRALFDRGGRR